MQLRHLRLEIFLTFGIFKAHFLIIFFRCVCITNKINISRVLIDQFKKLFRSEQQREQQTQDSIHHLLQQWEDTTWHTLCEKCPNTDQKKLRIWTFFMQWCKLKILEKNWLSFYLIYLCFRHPFWVIKAHTHQKI